MLTDAELDRYARHIVLREVGGAGQQRIQAAHVAVIGAGGIGCPVIEYLAAAGVGKLTVVDDDTVSLSNLQRQTLYRDTDVGQSKADVAARAAVQINPHVTAVARADRVTADTIAALLDRADVVIDGTDNFATRLIVADAAWALRIPLVSAAIAQFNGQIAMFRGWEQDRPCYRCFVGEAFDADDCDSCAEHGVLGAMCGLVGSFAAMEVLRQIAGFGDDAAGKLHIIDGLRPVMRTVSLPKDPGCRTCGPR